MPRRPPGSVRRGREPAGADAAPVRAGRAAPQETREGTFLVQAVSGAAAVKTYRCPGCQHDVQPGVPHVVVWPADGDVAERRHWHSSCWHRRATRGGPGRLPWTVR